MGSDCESSECLDPAITFEGRPISDYVTEKQKAVKLSETLGVHRESLRVFRYHPPAVGDETQSQKRVARRVRYLPPEQIRKEYGLKMHPFTTAIENIVYVIQQKGPLDTPAISKESNVPEPATYVHLRKLRDMLPDLFMVEGGRGRVGPARYRIATNYADRSVESIYQEFTAAAAAKKKGRETKPEAAPHAEMVAHAGVPDPVAPFLTAAARPYRYPRVGHLQLGQDCPVVP